MCMLADFIEFRHLKWIFKLKEHTEQGSGFHIHCVHHYALT